MIFGENVDKEMQNLTLFQWREWYSLDETDAEI
jgi:hypothetical protein